VLHATIFTNQGLSGMIEGDEGLYVCVCERASERERERERVRGGGGGILTERETRDVGQQGSRACVIEDRER
jgi:hypothetical protein